MERIKLKEMEPGKTYRIPVLLQSATDATMKTGGEYVKLGITDGDMSVTASNFNKTRDDILRDGIEIESLIFITLVKTEKGYYNFTDVMLCMDPAIDIKDFVKCAPINIDEGFEYIVRKVKESAVPEPDGSIRFAEVTEYILRQYESEFKHSSAAKSMHHNYIGGLVHHTASMIQMAEKVCEVYTDLDKELLICGTALHDIGKLEELDTNKIGAASYTVEGVLLGHLWGGATLIERTFKNVFHKDADNNVLMLEHMIASHHGKPEYGTIVRPAFKEAYVLHAIDMLDSRMQLFNNEYEKLEPGVPSENSCMALDGVRVYRPLKS